MAKVSPQAQNWIDALKMQPHPEGGWFAEVFRAAGTIAASALPGHVGARPFLTSIYFMLVPGSVSRFHRLKSDEIWYHHAGGSLNIHQIDAAGNYSVARLGCNLAAGEKLQVVVPAGVWFGATLSGDEEALVGCAVAPGFDFADFEMPDRSAMLKLFPQHAPIIERLTWATDEHGE
ncbi:MAG TPA: cupin domain-containing protein [Candidatus Rifleibacterium sp.]|nr:cupin domain-containing protein [Candidatus Rifleibacterium sp.]